MKFILLTLSFFFTSLGVAQNLETKKFPKDFIGTYKGDLIINNDNGSNTIPMEFHLKPTNSPNEYDYIIVYVVNDTPSPRNYKLIVEDQKKGLFKIDEKNGIILNAKFNNNTLTSIFEVEGSLLVTTERFTKDAMFFDILFSKKKNQVITTTTEGNTSVISFPITTTQSAKLLKQ